MRNLDQSSKGGGDALFPGNSAMAGRMRAFDWSQTPLGSPETWPDHVRAALSSLCCDDPQGPPDASKPTDVERIALQLKEQIEGRKRAEENAGRLQILLDHAPALIFVKDHEGRYVYLNNAYEKQFALTDDWYGKTDFDFWSRESAELFRKNDALVLASGRIHQFLEDSTDLAGTRYCWLCYKFPFTDSRQAKFLGAIGIDATDRVLAEEALEEREAELAEAQRITKIGSWAFNIPTGEVRWSEELYRIFEINKEEMDHTYEAFLERLHPDDVSLALQTNSNARATGCSFNIEYRIVTQQGKTKHIREIGHASRNAGGEVVRLFGTAQDITEQKSSEEAIRHSAQELKRLVLELERSNKDLEQFAYVASHDLQEPLHQVSGFVEMFNKYYRPMLDERAKQFLNYMFEGTSRMSVLIKDLLAYSRIGRNATTTQLVDTAQIVNNALNDLRLRLDENVAEVTTENLPVVNGNPLLLGQLFQNLISNALKFRSEYSPQIHIGCRREENTYLFWVKDNGIGFNQESSEKIFDMFRRLHNHQNIPGTGIGLSICKRVVELHGGNIWAESHPGQGSTFFFTIPSQ